MFSGSKLVARIVSGHAANPDLCPSSPMDTIIGGGWKTVLSVCFKGAFLFMHDNSRRKPDW